MKAFVGTSPMDYEHVLQSFVIPKPSLETLHDILVKIDAVSVNLVDIKVRNGAFSAPPTPEDSLKVTGCDAVGTVAEVGAGVARFEVGDKVFYTRAGINAESPNFSSTEKQTGMVFLVTGGAAGVGSMVIQVAKNAGFTVIATHLARKP
ncbi:putative oxidoreductase [Powellomyces hirtus]|nr:putative oxidoreductase [Powellomyces hirtus]